jgi:Type II CAAX prenyl endopeptidase Rce1-like
VAPIDSQNAAHRENTHAWTAVYRNVAVAAVAASKHVAIQIPLALALIVPLVATIGQYWTSGFFRQSVGVDVLFWPTGKWHWAIPMNVTAIVAVLGSSYLLGIGWLLHRRTLGSVIFAGIGALIVAQLLGSAVNHFTGWRELQIASSMDMAGKANRLILALWHNPIWEEVVFRGIPLLCYSFFAKKAPPARKVATWCYFLIPSLVFAAYHVPGHGYSRITDSFLLGLVFAWLALRYGFCAVMVLHYIFDALLILSLGKFKNIPTDEVRWLADRFGILNSTFFLTSMAVLCLMIVLFVRHLWRANPRVGDSPGEPGSVLISGTS